MKYDSKLQDSVVTLPIGIWVWISLNELTRPLHLSADVHAV